MKKIKKRSYPNEFKQQAQNNPNKKRSLNAPPKHSSNFISETRENDELNFDSLLVNLEEINESFQFTESSDLFLDFNDEELNELNSLSNFDYLGCQEEIEMKKKFEENLFDLFLIPPLLSKQSKKHKDKMTLVLDLDQTLVYSCYDQPNSYDFKFLFPFQKNTKVQYQSDNTKTNKKENESEREREEEEEEEEKEKELEEEKEEGENHNSEQHTIYVQKRPHLKTFLETCSQLFEVVVFTAGTKEYADIILDELDPNNVLISHRLYRDSCKEVEQDMYVKDLSLLGRDLDRVLIIDDLPSSYSLQPQNAIPIEKFCGNYFNSSFYYDDDEIFDNELPRILEILEKFKNAKTVFSILQKHLEY
ncbi:scp1-like small phosphatase 4-related [Anaeramoeba flamelloides]|uniref:Scp1-like small phosphatase 4-related n=1 Tax=Anaeramoeba flamelloides TaxID=1746091 RepID=A0ABQ8Z842_9EUKA|nr:scp1-like small phosphatase 4-related [Anaeramoeba flamelloides]